jgi:hypothetical protein
MTERIERRTEQRLRYHWPIWFAEDFGQELSQGQMIDISSRGAAFAYNDDGNCPYPGQRITARFSVPRYGADESFDLADFTIAAQICRIDYINNIVRRVALQFAEPLPFRPGEQETGNDLTNSKLRNKKSKLV